MNFWNVHGIKTTKGPVIHKSMTKEHNYNLATGMISTAKQQQKLPFLSLFKKEIQFFESSSNHEYFGSLAK